MKTILIYSGGLDSTSLMYHLRHMGDKLECLHFLYGSKHSKRELEAARFFTQKLGIPLREVGLDFVPQLFRSALLQGGDEIPEGHYEDPTMQRTVVPGRNTIMLSIAIGYAESQGAQRVAIANHAGDHAIYPDCRPEWVASMSLAAYHGTYQRIGVLAPFTHWDKGQICRRAHELGVDLAQTWTCYQGGKLHCGRCGACVERKEAFAKAKLVDLTIYEAVDAGC